MEIKQTLKMPPAALYKQIIHSVLVDINQQTGQALRPDQLNGFSYRKRFNAQQEGQITITQNLINQSYHYETKTNRNHYEIGYDITPADDGQQSLLTYNEKVIANRDSQQLNNWLSVTLLGWGRKHNFKKMLRAMEDHYQSEQV
ncbi:hypothetical protein IV38_GL001616 [Lactobacillus selangorensis]|uniref:DUF3284 domain-containing protein n=1 Tax=Lactobacillus selangorensis TaxID=81857 RepID=A0A0R2FTS5_9LACO|nr:DUF3284 domain-containing protein [Lactobacillus selangorensis]KRN28164.1 hypothetical protein IV38_GL001616 [Lactobacillus selangorensis]KRN30960.1 hypothetical protein IV40_GL001599 [Lactobacillus selangorensis]